MKLDELTQRFKPQSAEDWEALSFQFLQDEFDCEIIEQLRSDLREHGSFREAVVLSLEDEHISNGQHRIIAGLLEGKGSLNVTTQEPEREQLPCYEIRVKLEDGFIIEEREDRLISALRSFKVNENFWVECFLATRGGLLLISCHCSPDDIDQVLLEIGKRMKRVGLDVKGLSHTKIENGF